ncbi:MAG: ABC transporter ATP-binding protein [Bacteroidota bacterium]
METFAVEINNVQYSYDSNPFINNLNLSVKQNDRFGLFGPNGAGKTTIMSLMTGLLKPKAGAVTVFGKSVSADKRVKSILGFVPQDFSFYSELTPKENLQFFGAWYGLNKTEIKSRTEELLSVLGLSDVANKQVKLFSGGMKRRVNIAIGVIHKPQVLFLDEPTAGVDIQSRHAIVNYLKDINAKGTTLIYTSHHLKEAEELCQHIALIDEGKIIAHGEMKQLIESNNETTLEGLFLKLTGNAYRD